MIVAVIFLACFFCNWAQIGLVTECWITTQLCSDIDTSELLPIWPTLNFTWPPPLPYLMQSVLRG